MPAKKGSSPKLKRVGKNNRVVANPKPIARHKRSGRDVMRPGETYTDTRDTRNVGSTKAANRREWMRKHPELAAAQMAAEAAVKAEKRDEENRARAAKRDKEQKAIAVKLLDLLESVIDSSPAPSVRTQLRAMLLKFVESYADTGSTTDALEAARADCRSKQLDTYFTAEVRSAERQLREQLVPA